MFDEKPGGSAKVPGFGLDGGVELRSSTHWGGGGGGIDAAMMGLLELLAGLKKISIKHRGDVLPRPSGSGCLHLPLHASMLSCTSPGASDLHFFPRKRLVFLLPSHDTLLDHAHTLGAIRCTVSRVALAPDRPRTITRLSLSSEVLHWLDERRTAAWRPASCMR